VSVWRKTALEKIPELRRLIEESRNVMSLWIDLGLKLDRLYQSQSDEKTIAGIYDYASWCLNHSHNGDTQTAVVCAFYEHLPQQEATRKDIPNRLSMDDFLKVKEVFKHLLSDEEYERFVKEFLQQKAGRKLKA
jgi:hypothetical protein